MASTVGILIQEHLRRQNITAADVQRRVGLSKTFVGRWIKNPRADRPVTPDTLERMARAIGADIVELTVAELESCGYKIRRDSDRGWPGSRAWDQFGRNIGPSERQRIIDFLAPLFPAGQ